MKVDLDSGFTDEMCSTIAKTLGFEKQTKEVRWCGSARIHSRNSSLFLMVFWLTCLYFHCRRLRAKTTEILKNLFTMFVKSDATLVEVNPFVETSDGSILCLDAKVLLPLLNVD